VHGTALPSQKSPEGYEAMSDQDDTWGGMFWVREIGIGWRNATPGEACDEIERLRAENARLRAALVYIGKVCISHDRGDEAGRALGHIADHARAALEVKP